MATQTASVVDSVPMGVFSRDTSARAERIQTGIYRSMSPQERYAIGVGLSDDLRDVALAGLRNRHPTLPQADLMRLYVRDVLGWKLPSRRERSIQG